MCQCLAVSDSSHGLVDKRAWPLAPNLVGRWILASNDNDGNEDRALENDVFKARTSLSTIANLRSNGDGNNGSRTRLPPAQASGVLRTAAGVPLAPSLEGAQEVWGFSVRVIPQFPSDIGSDSAHPWLRQRFESFLSLVWGDETKAQAVNVQLIRYVLLSAYVRFMHRPKLITLVRAICLDVVASITSHFHIENSS